MNMRGDIYIKEYKDKYKIERTATAKYSVIYIPTNDVVCICDSEIKATKVLIGVALYQAIDNQFEAGAISVVIDAVPL